MRDLRTDELSNVYGAGGCSKVCAPPPPKCAPKASKSKKSKSKKCKASKSKKGWC
jgi:hypothetical protein